MMRMRRTIELTKAFLSTGRFTDQQDLDRGIP
jgi:hypothetical protein